MASPRIENGIVVGTSGAKYDSKNPLAVHLLREFDRVISELAAHAAPKSILEVGCGEGHIIKLLLDNTSAPILATDLSESVLDDAKQAISSDRVTFRTADIMEIDPVEPAPDLVVCCEVLEHLPDPQGGLEALQRQRANWYILSVPREPIWRLLNMARGAYLRDFGNSPGHLQHWSQREFLKFIGQAFEPVIIRAPLPWTVVLCRPHDRPA